ncbi:hypothetical protein AAHC03_019400 [Spirometra sp. Aus1]|nr:unnamed protein product [Spirometra erinaceieuropaei]
MPSYVSLVITSTAFGLKSEKRYPLDLTLGKFKEKLVLMTGCEPTTMKLELLDDSEKHVSFLTDDFKTLEELGVKDGYHVRASDPTVEAGHYDKLLGQDSSVDFKLTEEEYAQREDTVLAWKKRNKIGKFKELDPEEARKAEEKRLATEAAEKALIEKMKVGDRCEVRIPQQPTKRGEIMFLGLTKFKEGQWVGVKYDEPLGRNDGSIDGVRYFDCPPKYGAFVKPAYVEVGDFPELGIDDLDEI